MDTGNDMKITKQEENSAGKEKKQSAKMELYDWVQCIVSALVVGILLFVFVGRVVNVRGESMYSTLKDGDKVICSKLFYSPKQGDIVVFRPENNDVFDYSLVKRIVAVEGQTLDIDFDSGTVYIDGEEVYEPYIFEQTYDDEDFTGPMTVPEGKL
ncbi:MAG: signal peptidase I, partial [Oscillospiraceae bacterium]|nr:signal peptidase I [Oscillospiraceae bacterium]